MDGEMEQPLQEHSLSISSTEAGSFNLGHGPSEESQNPSMDLEKSELDRIRNFYKGVLSAILTLFAVAVTSSSSHFEAHVSSLLAKAGEFFLFTTSIGTVALMIVDMLMPQKLTRASRAWYRILTVLVAVVGMMLILADTVLFIITNKNNTVLAVVLAPVMVLVGVFTSAGAWMEEQFSSTTHCSRYDFAMTCASEMALVGTYTSFTLQASVIFGHLKSPGGNQDKHGPPLDLAACYATSTLSVVVIMVSAMPLRLLPGGMLEVLAMIVQKLRHAMLVALAMMALVVSVEFLDGLVVLSFFPEVIAIVLYYAVKFISACQPREENSAHHYTYQMVTSGGFTLMTRLYAAFVGIDHYDVYLKAAMFILLLTVLSSLSRLANPFHIPEVGGAIEICIASVTLAYPMVAFLVAWPLVLKVLIDLYLHR